jgi:ankyrin repeat protein
MLAAKQNNGFLCYVLLSRGAELNARNQAGQTALRFALDYGGRQTAQDLLLYHAKWDVKDRDALLSDAAGCGLTDFVRELLDRGANIDARDEYGNSPLIRALIRDRGDTAKLLLARGADISIRNAEGGAALLAASGTSYPEIVESLLAKGADAKMRRTDKLTPLMVAAQRGNLRIMEILSRQGAEVNVRDVKGDSALSLARAMKALWNERIKSHARTGSTDPSNLKFQPQRMPGERRYEETIAWLIQKGATEEPAERRNEETQQWQKNTGTAQ